MVAKNAKLELKPWHMAFIAAYIANNGIAHLAYQVARPSAKSPTTSRTESSKLLKRPYIQAALAQAQAQVVDKAVARVAWTRQRLTEELEAARSTAQAMGRPDWVIKACEVIGRVNQLFDTTPIETTAYTAVMARMFAPTTVNIQHNYLPTPAAKPISKLDLVIGSQQDLLDNPRINNPLPMIDDTGVTIELPANRSESVLKTDVKCDESS